MNKIFNLTTIFFLFLNTLIAQSSLKGSVKDIENQELPNDIEWLGKMVQDICYFNAKTYFSL